MTISLQSSAKLKALAAAAMDLMRIIGEERMSARVGVMHQWAPISSNVERYLALVQQGQSNDDPVLALKGANLLTTVNKGVGDAEQEPADRPLTELAFHVTRLAIDAARSLRGDAGAAL